MDIDYLYFLTQRERNAAWNLLCAERAPVILAFVHEGFIAQGRTSAPESELIEILRDIIFFVNGNKQQDNLGPEFYGESEDSDEDEALSKGRLSASKRKKLASSTMVDNPQHYLRLWSSDEHRYFRCSYLGPSGSEPFYDITPELQKAYSFIVNMNQGSGQNFVPTESRFKELLEILKDVHMSTEGNADMYLQDLLKKREALDREIEKAKRGEVAQLTPSQLREKFLQFQRNALDLVDDFAQVEYNLCELDKEIMQDVVNWNGPRGELLDKYFNQNAYIENTDQGRSVKAFSTLLLSSNDDELIVNSIQKLLSREELKGLQIDERLYNIHDQWLARRLKIESVMGASTKRIKSFLRPENLESNMFLKERIKSICDKVVELTKAEGLRALPSELLELEVPFAPINLPFDRPLATISERLEFNTETKSDQFKINDAKLFDQVVVDPIKLYHHINVMLQDRDEVSLSEIVDRYPLEHGITELTTYVKLAMFDYDIVEDDSKEDLFRWEALDPEGNRVARVAKLKHITLKRR